MSFRSQEKVSSRVNITYDVPLPDGTLEKVSLPFVVGVMADLSGKPDPSQPLKPVEERTFAEFTHDNFDEQMARVKPRVAFQVENVLTPEDGASGDLLNVAVSFEKMDDFSPANVARNVEPLRKLLETRQQLENLLTHLDGNARAEEAIAQILNDPDLMAKLANAAKPTEGTTNG